MKILTPLFILLFGIPAMAGDTLFIGDSHSYFSARSETRLGALLVKSFPDLNFYSACGSSPLTWVNGGSTSCGWRVVVPGGSDETKTSAPVPKLAALLEKHKPKTLWIEQGDNMFSWDAQSPKNSLVNENSVRNQILALVSLLDKPEWQNVQCYWIGPTWGGRGSIYNKTDRALEFMYTLLAEHAGARCKLIDSREFVRSYVGSDGLHLSSSGSKEWGENLVRELKGLP